MSLITLAFFILGMVGVWHVDVPFYKQIQPLRSGEKAQNQRKIAATMRLSDLHVLRCPFCGGPFALERNSALEIQGDDMTWGVIWCECSAYPVADGIPYLRPGQITKDVLTLLESGHRRQGLARLLGIKPEVQCPTRFREALPLLCSGPEAQYLLHRFSDPTFLVSDSLLRALPKPAGRCLDICGGAGHLARGHGSWVADLEFWKLWLARKIVAPDCTPVCCDASQPLPFAREKFSFVFSSDGLNYIFQKRLFVAEASRVLTESGVLLLTHLHNALYDNPSAGMPLSATGYRALNETLPARLYKESECLDAILAKRPLDLSTNYKDGELQTEAAFIVLASRDPKVFHAHESPLPYRGGEGRLAINPLYEVEPKGNKARLRLRFPSKHYEQEFGCARRYLPEELEIDPEDLNRPELLDQRVVLFLPKNY